MPGLRFFSLLLIILWLAPISVQGQVEGGIDVGRLEACQDGAWSSEIDFVTAQATFIFTIFDKSGSVIRQVQAGEPTYISDGDLLSMDHSVICALNFELLFNQYDELFPPDLGLDAVDIINFDEGLVVFSTELSDPFGNFNDGDLLFSTGGSVPIDALMYRFHWQEWRRGEVNNLGLDAVHFVGDADDFMRIVELAGERAFHDSPRMLADQLEQNGIDIWFSIEGTIQNPDSPANSADAILDGDVLSALDGNVVITQRDLGISSADPRNATKNRYDFGVDALGGTSEILFSTELPHDGDIYKREPPGTPATIFIPHFSYTNASVGIDDPLGLDALWYP